MQTLNLLGVPLALGDYKTTMDAIEEMADRDRPAALSFCNTHLVAQAAGDPAFREVLNRFDLNLPDGMPLVWALNQRGAALRDRVYGPSLMQKFFERSTERPLRHFLFGSSPAILGRLDEALTRLNPTAAIVGTLSPPFRPFTAKDNAAFAEAINAVRPDCIWVALGGIRQEKWIHENLHRFSRGVFLAVGDAFGLLAGETSFAPAWMQRSGLTWLHRLSQDPVRLWSRYLKCNSLFLFHLLTGEKRQK